MRQYWTICQQVLADDRACDFGGHIAIPHVIRLHDHRARIFTPAQASGARGVHHRVQSLRRYLATQRQRDFVGTQGGAGVAITEEHQTFGAAKVPRCHKKTDGAQTALVRIA